MTAEPSQTVPSGSDAKGLHVVLLNQPFHPDVAATAQMAKDLADHLVRSGHRVTAIASRSVYGKAGAVLPKRESIPVEGAVSPIEVRRVGVSLFGKKSIIARAADFAFFYLLAAWSLLGVKKPDVVVGFTTPPFVHLLAIGARWFKGAKAVHWLMDLYPDVAIECGVLSRRNPASGVFEFLSRTLLKRSDRIVVLGRCMRDRVIDKGVAPDMIEHIPVWADHSNLAPVPHEENPLRTQWNLAPEQCCVMYSGNFGIAHEAQTICRAMERLADVPFIFVGAGKRRAEVEAFIESHAVPNARYLDYVPRDQLRYSIGAGDIHLISVRNGLEGLIVPSKLFGVMAAGRPAVYVGSPKSEIALIINETGCGACIEEGDDESLAEAIRRLATDPHERARMGSAGREALAERFDTQRACEDWRALLERIARR
ncbi:MAG: glycosyltransferase family 4 protein [Planctomycetota bacterium]